MKMVRVRINGRVSYGMIQGDEIVLCAGDPWAGLTPGKEALALAGATLLAPVEPPNIICVGLNYKGHAAESNHPLPEKPIFFLKATSSLSGPGDPIVLPAIEPDAIDCEAELAMVIKKRAKQVSEKDALDYVLGYTIGNDVSNKAAQRADGQWVRGKSHDTFCPLGPVVVTDLDPDNLDITCRIDGEVRQSSNTGDMIFSCARLVSYISRNMTLLPGTVIMTGTPQGLGCYRNPPVFLKAGQRVEITIGGIGVLSNPVAGPA